MPTVGRLAREFGLSRSTLLYYDAIGLLHPSGRTGANYRIYSAADRERLARICAYRGAGLTLHDIKRLLDAEGDATAILRRQLRTLNDEIAQLRDQQRVIVRLLEGAVQAESVRTLDKARWVAILRAAGLSDDDMNRWHAEFERLAPEAHADFLASLGIATDEAEAIRAWSRRLSRA